MDLNQFFLANFWDDKIKKCGECHWNFQHLGGKMMENAPFHHPGAPNSMIFLGFLAFQAFKVFQAFLLISQRPPAPTHPHEIEPTIDIDHLMVEEN